VTLGALVLAGCGESSSTAASANAGGGVSVTTSGTTAESTTATVAGTGSDASPASDSKATGGGSTGDASSAGSGTQTQGTSRGSGAHKHASVKAGSRQASAGSPTPAGSSPPSANTGVPYEVSTISMRPSYQPETKAYYDPTRTHPRIGEVIIFYLPTGATEGECGKVAVGGAPCEVSPAGLTRMLAIKRVVGLPGDTIVIHNGHVIRNGQPEPEPRTEACKEAEEGCNFPKAIVVPAGRYYVMGDNRRLPQEDSRVFGAIPQEAIVGTVEGG
jgi:signal peptidase I